MRKCKLVRSIFFYSILVCRFLTNSIRLSLDNLSALIFSPLALRDGQEQQRQDSSLFGEGIPIFYLIFHEDKPV